MERVESLPVLSRAEPGEIAAMLPDTPPERPEPWDAILADLDRVVLPGVTHWQSPTFFGYFPANSSPEAILGDLASSGLGVQGMLWLTSPACTEIETRVLDWLADLIGLPEPFTSRSGVGGGVIQGTASEAVLVAMLAARDRMDGNAGLTAYGSTQAHSSVVKAAKIAGVGRERVRLIETDDALAMDPAALARAIDDDRAAGRTPFFVCATLGTTSTGAIDPVEEIGRVLDRPGAARPWLHVDAAWAGAACVCPEHRQMLGGVERADSFNFNPHKWLLTTFDCSALWVRDRGPVLDALSITPEYLRNRASDAGAVIDYRDWQVPLGRRFRALKLWFVIRGLGAEGLREHIRRSISLASDLETRLRADPRFEVPVPRSLALVCFRLRGEDARTERLLERVNASGEAFFTHTRIEDRDRPGETRLVIRAAVGGVWTRAEHIDRAWRALDREAGRASL
ncbi:MAG: aspartate aminotransferase family protein [Planctomycetota bacterium]|nr:MAG: aspartate aminotransferase family protein [Planctomycetota bacterium]